MEGAITPEEIRGADFTIALRGYDRAEVEAFLREVAAEMAELKESSESPYQAVGEDIGQLLQQTKDLADRLLLDAQTDAATLVQNAANEAAGVTQNAEVYANQLREQVDTEATRSRAEADRLFAERIREADGRVRELGIAENEARQRIAALRTELEEVAKSLLHLGAEGSPAPPDSEQTIEKEADQRAPVKGNGAVAAPPLGTTQMRSNTERMTPK
jgi:DivIVA domain-containing protein